MRRFLVGAVAIAMLSACGGGSAGEAFSRSHSPQVCATPYTGGTIPRIELSLSNADGGRSVSVHLCSWISVVLTATGGRQWQGGVQSSDQSVLAVVPIPLPAPPPGGVRDVLAAQRTGRAVLSAATAPDACSTCGSAGWSVSVTVVA